MTFECAINVTGYSLSFVTYLLVTDPVLVSTEIASLNLTVTATSEVNGTNVTCQAATGVTTNVTAPAYLYVQGQYTKCTYLIFNIDRSA